MHLIRFISLLALTFSVAAQSTNDLTVDNIEVINSVGDFNQPVVQAVGELLNQSETSAYTHITLSAQAYDADDTLIGEGIGVLDNACGVGLLPDFALQPGAAQTFSAPLELSDPEAEIIRVEISTEADTLEPVPTAPLADGITQITDAETVNVEWDKDFNLRFATGCETDLFTEWTWNLYNTGLEAFTQISAPHAADVTDEMRARIELEDDEVFAHSTLRYAPGGDRLVYQNARNDFLTAFTDGRTRRGLYIGLNNRSLQGIYWQPDERFIAYYFGAYGDPVYYFVADAEARVVSPALLNNPPSVIVPGLSRDARRVVVAGEFEGVTGYFLYVVTNNFFELQFEAEPPGNNFPAPIPLADAESDLINRIYVARLVNGEARIQCYNREEDVLHDLAALPLRLADDERAWWWISPDESQIALAADGVNGGLWLIDLSALPACASE
ncbi:MAG: hypothetical protein ABI835_19235 [Chloroflexota bacterium]